LFDAIEDDSAAVFEKEEERERDCCCCSGDLRRFYFATTEKKCIEATEKKCIEAKEKGEKKYVSKRHKSKRGITATLSIYQNRAKTIQSFLFLCVVLRAREIGIVNL
jgi:hypothetical protein